MQVQNDNISINVMALQMTYTVQTKMLIAIASGLYQIISNHAFTLVMPNESQLSV